MRLYRIKACARYPAYSRIGILTVWFEDDIGRSGTPLKKYEEKDNYPSDSIRTYSLDVWVSLRDTEPKASSDGLQSVDSVDAFT